MKIKNVSDRDKNFGFFKRYLRKKFIREQLKNLLSKIVDNGSN